jgi:protein phosphatase 1 regulatory subunit 7
MIQVYISTRISQNQVLPELLQELNLVHARISSISELKLLRFAPYLTRLCLRQNFISHLDEDVFHALTKLEELDFYDNKIKHVGRALDNLKDLRLVIPGSLTVGYALF